MAVADQFDYTRKSFWGGPSYPYWMLITATIFFGFFGVDHFLLRSPTSGAIKFLVNILGLGIWYFYDIIQIVGDKQHVKDNGLTIPVIGVGGIGAGMCVDDQPEIKVSKSPLRFLLYLFLVFVPFGFDNFIAGDTNGAFAKFVTCINPLFWIVAIIWSCVSIFRVYFMPKAVFTEGLMRPFPVSWFMNPRGRSILGPVEVPKSPDSCDPGGTWGIGRSIIKSAEMLMGSALEVIAPGVRPAAAAVAGATTAVAGTIKAGAETAGAALGVAKQGIETISKVALPIIEQGASAVTQTGALTGAVGSQLSAFTDPTKLAQMAIKAPMSGGGMGGEDSLASSGLLILFAGILLSGTFLAVKRLNISFGKFTRDKDGNRKGQQRNDTPP